MTATLVEPQHRSDSPEPAAPADPNYQPRHRRDIVAELAALCTEDETVRHRVSPVHIDQHVMVTHRDDLVVLVATAAAADVLGQVLSRYTSAYHGPTLGGPDAYDAPLWQDVAIDLLRHKALAGHLPALRDRDDHHRVVDLRARRDRPMISASDQPAVR